MKEYHKIQTLFKRDMKKPGKPLIEGDWTNDEFLYLANKDWIFTEKVDGMNIRVILDTGKVVFKGKTDNAQLPSELLERLQELFPVDKLSSVFTDSVCLYGEGYGKGIQKGGVYKKYQDFVLFDVMINSLWLKRDSVSDIASKLGIHIVPIVGIGTLYQAIEKVKAGFNSTWGDFPAEGIVVRPVVDLLSRNGERIIAKIKTRDFIR